MTNIDNPDVERFHATTGRVTGWMTVVLAALVSVGGLAYLDEGFPDWLVATAFLVGVLGWSAMLRPALWVRDGILVMRNMLETVEIRLVAIEELAVRQVLAVRAADRRWISTAIGRSLRKTMTSGRRPPPMPDGKAATTVKYVDYVDERLHKIVEDARDAAGIRPGSPEQLALPDAVRREWSWVPIVLIAVATVALVVTLVV